jgi:hypothetical protein
LELLAVAAAVAVAAFPVIEKGNSPKLFALGIIPALGVVDAAVAGINPKYWLSSIPTCTHAVFAWFRCQSVPLPVSAQNMPAYVGFGTVAPSKLVLIATRALLNPARTDAPVPSGTTIGACVANAIDGTNRAMISHRDNHFFIVKPP